MPFRLHTKIVLDICVQIIMIVLLLEHLTGCHRTDIILTHK